MMTLRTPIIFLIMFHRSYTQVRAILSREHHAGPKCNDWQAMMIVDAPENTGQSDDQVQTKISICTWIQDDCI